MSVRNLDAVFRPRSLALIGASPRPDSVGGVLLRNIRAGGFAGAILPVNPRHAEIDGLACHADVAALPQAPDLAVICTPPDTVPAIVAALGARGTKGAVVITAGFGEGGADAGRKRRQAMLDAARPHLLRIIGPNCVGIAVPPVGLNATFMRGQPATGRLAFASQSGAILAGIVDWAEAHAVGFSHLISLGDMSDVDFGDTLDYLGHDAGTSAILLYIEAVTEARKFMSAARAASRLKPVIVMKAGRHAEGARAAASHTGAIAGADDVYDAAFRRAGMLRVTSLLELFEAAEMLATAPSISGDRLTIVSNGGGFGVLATDALIDFGGTLAELSDDTRARLDAVLPATWSRGNPVDIIGDADGGRYVETLAAVMADDGNDALLVMHCPTALTSSVEAADAIVAALGTRPRRPVIGAWIGESAEAIEGRRILRRHGLPAYDTPSEAVRAFMQMVDFRRNQDALMQTPAALNADAEPDRDGVAALIAAALAVGRDWLGEAEAKAVLAAYRIPTVETRIAATTDAAVKTASEIGYPVAIKILSPDILHKSDIGGVALDLDTAETVAAAAAAMLQRAAEAAPSARIDGFTVQRMVHRRRAHELIVGMTCDATFGPVILFGQGGTAVEVIRDRALALPPLNRALAEDLLARTRIDRLLRGYRDRPAANREAIADVLVRLSALLVAHPEIQELDINPLLADAAGVIALDARIRLAAATAPGDARLAIRPYPAELEQTIALADGRTLLLRPIRPEDEPALHEGFKTLSIEAVYFRFFSPLKALSHQLAARLTQIDYDREMALVIASMEPAGHASLFAVARLAADPDNETAEIAIVVRDDMQGLGIGTRLLRTLMDYADTRGIGVLFGTVLRENRAMLELCRKLGFTTAAVADDPTLIDVRLTLQDTGRTR